MNYGDPWLIIKLHDCVFPFWHAILQPVLTITMNKMHWNETQLMNEQKLTWVGTNSAGPVIHQCERSIVIFHTITLDIMHSHPRCHIYAIISSVMITDWPCVATYQMHRNETQLMNKKLTCVIGAPLFGSTLAPRAQSHFGTAPAPGHVRQVFWIDDATATRGQLGGRIRFGYGQCGGESGTEFE